MVIAAFPPGEKYAVNYTTLNQYDYGQILRIQGLKLPKTVEVHFSTQETGGTSITRVGVTKDGVTDVLIPDSVLENGDTTQNYSIFAFVYITDATSGKTEYRAKLEVKARSKPEVPGGGNNPDAFHEAVLAVRESAEKAEEAQKQAEGYAHGREDLPERAEDNAKYYCGKASEDAKKTAEDRKEVERLVESVSGIDEQVAKVEKLSKNAQEAATQAGTSAEQAELHKQAAETASSAAQTAAQETEADKVSVEKLSAQVQKNKESVDKTAQDFALNTQQALADVNNAGQAQTERVQTAGTTAVENIKNAQNMATQAVETAKSEAIKAVQAEGTKQTGAVTAEGRKQVQAVQAATQEIVADREQITNNKTEIADLRQNKADAIVETASGTLLNIKDSANAFFGDFKIFGKTEQVQTTGKNLFSCKVERGTYAATAPEKIESDNSRCRSSDLLAIDSGFNGIISVSKGFLIHLRMFKGNVYIKESTFSEKHTINNSENDFDKITVIIKKIDNSDISDIEIKEAIKVQLEKGTAVTSYEPYTGGKPSPSPEYPQEIINAGKLNEDTGKYEVDVKVTGKNIVNIPDFGADTPETVKECYISKNICISAQEKADVSKSVWRFKALHKDGSLEYITDAALPGCFYATEENPIVSITYRGIYTTREYKGIMVEYGTVATKYEPYKEQTLTLTSDRPLTKWDRLVEQNGQIGWLYGSKSYKVTGKESFESRKGYNTDSHTNRFFTLSDLPMDKSILRPLAYVKKLKHVLYCYSPNIKEEGFDTNSNQFHIKFSNDRVGILASDDSTVRTSKFSEYMKKIYEDGKPIELLYMTTDTTFTPLPQEQQNAIRALQTYYPTTVVSNSEDMEMELSYVADTKNYTDRKIEEAVSAQTQSLANLLSLMPLSTQAAMIENDTNNILDMEVQK